MSSLPPPPTTPPPDPADAERPRWRSSSFAWLGLHLVIGVALSMGLIWLELGAIAAGGRDLLRVQNVPRTDTAMLRASAVVLCSAAVGGLGGWLLFVYLRASRRVRALTLAVCLGGAFTLAVLFLVPLLPSIP